MNTAVGRTMFFASTLALAGFSRGATTLEVSDVAGLTNAIAKAVNGDTIRLAAGYYDLSTLQPFKSGSDWGTMSAPDDSGFACLWFKKNLRITGADTRDWSEKTSAEETILDGGDAATIVYAYTGTGRDASFSHLTFENGNAVKQPGVSSGKTTLGNGGGIYAMGPTGGTVSNCVFRNCRAQQGGGVHAYIVRGSLFENCSAESQGGGAKAMGSSSYANQATNQFSDCVFRNCRAPMGGGLFFDECRTMTGPRAGYVADCVFSNCTATTSGGALYEHNAGLVRGCRFENNVSPSGAVAAGTIHSSLITNCTFVGNASTTEGGAVKTWNLVVDSSFSGNIATNTAGAVHGAVMVRGCTFEDNGCWAKGGEGGGAMRAGTSRDCTFRGNWTKGQGGALYAGTSSNCVFEANSSTNQGGACAYVTALDCTFRGNCATVQRGGAMCWGAASGCQFEDNFCAPSARGAFCAFTVCRDCRFTGIGDVSCGSFDHCEFDHVRQDGNNRTWLFDCVRNSGGGIGVTNCLVHHCEVRWLVSAEGQRADIVNCTFADNVMPDTGYVVSGNRGTDYKQNESGTGYRYYPSTVVVENCLFAGNRWQTKGNADLVAWMETRETDFGYCEMTLRNCVYANILSTTASDRLVQDNLKKGPAHFVADDTQYPGMQYYALRYKSAARNAGANAAWMASATDFAGNARIADSTVDVGCFECVLPDDATSIIFR